MSEELTPEAAARLVFEKGPLTKSEIKKLPRDRAFEYLETMNHFLKELGPEQFVARRDELREGTLRNIVNKGKGGQAPPSKTPRRRATGVRPPLPEPPGEAPRVGVD